VQIAPARGAFAVPFPGELWVRASRGAPVADARVEVKADGARVQRLNDQTDARGIARFLVTPSEHVVIARVSVVTVDGARAEHSFSVPVVPGAISIERRAGALLVRSPIEREAAFVALVTTEGRLSGARVPLSLVGDGTAQGSLELPPLPSGEVWAIAKSDPSAPSSVSVGWPLFENEEAARTFDVGDRLLLDTEVAATARERTRRREIRRLALAVGLSGAFLSALVVLLATWRGRERARTLLSSELGAEQSAELLPRQSARSVLAIVFITLGFLAVAAIAGWRLT
jgi:hypothetical protein